MSSKGRGYIDGASVMIEAAAELTGVDVATVRGWARSGDLIIEMRGDMETVRLDEVRALAARQRTSSHGPLRDRLTGADESESVDEPVTIADLQELARTRAR
ncbi:MAG: hypothetical protein ACRDG8_02725 [Actinomycetota bacterium]